MAEIDQIKEESVQQDVANDDERINHILSNLLKLASGEFNLVELSNVKHDSLDAIDRGLVMLGEQLESSRKRQEKHLEEKENLMKEIHHRVKNNLQIVSSLLSLQSKFSDNDIERHALRQSQYRIKSMSMIHEMLYKTDNISEVFLQDYLDKMMVLLIGSIKGNDHQITCDLKAPSVLINLDTAVTFGLLINEIVTNSLIHGIPEQGEIYVHFNKKDEEEFELRIGDNGIGFEESDDRNSLGLQLIEILSEQLNGRFEKVSGDGTQYIFTFKNKQLINTGENGQA